MFEGSTTVQGSVSSESEEEASSLSSSLQENSDDLGYNVISSNVDVYYDNSLIDGKDIPEEEGEIPVGLIVGVVVGGIAVIVIVSVVVYKYRKNKEASLQQINDRSELD